MFVYVLTTVTICFALFSPVGSAQTPPESKSPNNNENGPKGKAKPPSCFYTPAPPGTNAARAAHFMGTVDAEATITVDGKVENINIAKSPGLGLDESIVQTLKTWKCKPAIGPDGKPIHVTLSFHFNFHMN